ncbi:MAG: tRNA (N(6)-L-threonylcarbamoyladenosine(37)-C(2))-methylthiotransferase MtaB [Bdellovibrionales bacterium]|nr:tRNA (N(6)-L-threonylcarbamoyladenosine(37)-C(2))-methylthiotransferase MtaB [Bdellovibrionales bacterium]
MSGEHSGDYAVHTFGCKVNTYDTGLLEKRLSGAGFRLNSQSPHIHILNTCAVTAEATKEAQRTIRRIKARDPLALVVVTGCAAQVDTEKFAAMKGADLIVANSHKGQLEELIRQHYAGQLQERIFKSNIFKKMDLEEGGGVESQHTRAFLKIQDGCNSFCTYCVIPFARGKSRSLSVDTLVARVRELEAHGLAEVVLTGVHIGDYFDERVSERPGPEPLLRELLKRTRVPRIRLSSLEPTEVSDELLELYQDDRLCPHFHLSIQSACDAVLTGMKRQYSAQQVEAALERVAQRVPQVFVGMDVIAGFPGETSEQFGETVARLAATPWTRIHVFPYSERPGTFAARLPHPIERAEVLKRARELRELSSVRYAEQALAQIGQTKRVLILAGQAGQGLSRDFWPVQIEGEAGLPGTELTIRIQGYDHSDQGRLEGCLRGQLVIDAKH